MWISKVKLKEQWDWNYNWILSNSSIISNYNSNSTVPVNPATPETLQLFHVSAHDYFFMCFIDKCSLIKHCDTALKSSISCVLEEQVVSE